MFLPPVRHISESSNIPPGTKCLDTINTCRARKLYAHPGARVLKYAPPIHSIPLRPSQPINRTFTSHSNIRAQIDYPIAFGLGFGSGRRRRAPRPNPPSILVFYIYIYYIYLLLYTWYQVCRYTVLCSTSSIEGITIYY